MFGRIFGRGKDEPEKTVCAKCGRTLLAGEWTRKVTGPNGEEKLICSLCVPDSPFAESESVAVGPTPTNNVRVRESREEPPATGPAPPSDADVSSLQRELDLKDAEIERLQAHLASALAEREAFVAQMASRQAAPAESPEPVGREESVPAAPLDLGSEPHAGDEAPVPPVVAPVRDASEPGERTWGETPAEFATELSVVSASPDEGASEQMQPAGTAEAPVAAVAAGAVTAGVMAASAGAASDESPSASVAAAAEGPPAAPIAAVAEETVASEDTEPIPVGPEGPAPETAAEGAADTQAAVAPQDEPEGSAASTPSPVAAATAAEPSEAAREEEAAAINQLQRGVDLFNVSSAPRRIAETDEQLGLPTVRVDLEDQIVVLTFVWSMGWYRYHVDVESGGVRMIDRGYEELADVQPNVAARADGTVQLSSALISRAAVQRSQTAEETDAATQDEDQRGQRPVNPEPPSAVAQKPPEILSKSLLGQRSDDEVSSWEKTKARDFDWNH
jgi:hypothetical protein